MDVCDPGVPTALVPHDSNVVKCVRTLSMFQVEAHASRPTTRGKGEVNMDHGAQRKRIKDVPAGFVGWTFGLGLFPSPKPSPRPRTMPTMTIAPMLTSTALRVVHPPTRNATRQDVSANPRPKALRKRSFGLY